jgi:hypothetical protein
MPNKTQTHIDRALTEISIAYSQAPNSFIADKVFPVVQVNKQSDRYFMYKKEDWFRDDAEERAAATESAGGDYEIDNTPSYFCRKYAYHKDITEEDRANSDDPLTPDSDAVDFVTDKLLLRREIQWAAKYFATSIWAKEYTGVNSGESFGTTVRRWNDANSTPIEDIAIAATDIQETTGKRPNTLVIGQRVYDALVNHPDILDRIKYTQKGVVTVDLLAMLFGVTRVLIAGAIKNSANKGQIADMDFILGKHALLCYSAPKASLKTATAGYIFAWKGLMGANAIGGRILRIPMPWLGEGTERIEGEMTWDMKVVATDLGTFFNTVVA